MDRVWLMLAYRIPREPSTPRIAVWRKLRALGAGQLVDGLAMLPETDRTWEHFLWLAQEIRESGGWAALWRGQAGSPEAEAEAVAAMSDVIDIEYEALRRRAIETAHAPGRALAGLRAELRRIESRDYFGSQNAGEARAAVEQLATRMAATR